MIDQGFAFDRAAQQTDADTFVEVCYAESIEDASSLCKMLEQHAITALVETDPTLPEQCGVAVLVRADRLVEASEILTLEPRHHDAGEVVFVGDPDAHDPDCPEAASDQDEDEDDEDDAAVDLFEDHRDF